MRRTLVIAGLAFCGAVAAAPARAADNPCVYHESTKEVTYAFPTGSVVPLVQRVGSEIRIGTEGNDECVDSGSSNRASVTNTDTITLTGNPAPGATGQDPRLELGLKVGPLAPGFTNEGDGSSEIEINVPEPTGPLVVQVGRSSASETSAASDHFLAGKMGINLNADEATKDLDLVTGTGEGALAGAVLFGGNGNDELLVTGDSVTGGPLNSYVYLNGGEGNDKLSMAGSGTSFGSFTGGPGDDEMIGTGARAFNANSLSYGAATGPITVDLSNTGPQTIGGGEGIDTISGIYNVYGGTGADTITGDAGVNWIGGSFSTFVSDGADTIHGGGGGDLIGGGGGADHLFGDAGDDRLDGEGGEDDLHGGAEKDTLDGDSSSDPAVTDQMLGEEGDDAIELDTGNDSIDGGGGVDTIRSYGATGGLDIDLAKATTTNPGLGTDGITSMENVTGTFTFADTIRGDEGANELIGLGKSDVLAGRGGNDKLSVSTLAGEPAELDGGGGDDSLIGGNGPDTIAGGVGKDSIFSLDGDDTISAPADGEKDSVNCGAENDTVTSFDEGLDVLTACESSTAGKPGGGGGNGETPGGGGGEKTKPPPKKKPLKCKKGFKKVKVKGKARCKKVKRHKHRR